MTSVMMMMTAIMTTVAINYGDIDGDISHKSRETYVLWNCRRRVRNVRHSDVSEGEER